MEFDFCLEWQNIEYALLESEMVTLSEVYTGPITGNLGRNMNMARTGVRYAVGAPLMVGGKVLRQAGSIGTRMVGGTAKMAGNMVRNILMRDTFWRRLVERIQEIWQKFKNIIASLFKSNQSFINSELYNAEAVLRNALSNSKMRGMDTTFDDIYPYWKSINLLQSIQIPRLNTSDQSMMSCLDDRNTFIGRYMGTLRNIDFSGSDNGTSVLKQTLRGSSQPIQVGIEEIAANAKAMVEFIQNNDRYISVLNQEKDNILQGARQAETMARQTVQSFQGQDQNSFSNNYDAGGMEVAQRTLKRIQTYISIAQSILGIKETICHEYSTQSLNLLRAALRKCQAVTSGEVENTRMRHYISDDQLEDEPVKDYGNPKSLAGKFVTKKMAQYDASKQLSGKNDKNKKEFSLGDREAEYFATLPDTKEELRAEAKKAKAARQRLETFIMQRKLRADDPRFIEVKRIMDDYDRRIALLGKKSSQLPDDEEDEEE